MKKLLALRLVETVLVTASLMAWSACSSARTKDMSQHPVPPDDTGQETSNNGTSGNNNGNAGVTSPEPGAGAAVGVGSGIGNVQAGNGIQGQSPQQPPQAAGTVGNNNNPSIGQSNQTLGQSEVATEEVRVQPERRQVPIVTDVKTGADINRMTMADFEALGLPKDQAQMVIQYRATHGPFGSPGELSSVPTLDQQWLAKNISRLAAGKETG